MRFTAITRLAWKNLWSHRMRAVLTIGGVSLGIAAIIFLVSLGFGLERLVTSQVADFEAFTIIDVPSANLKTGKINQEAISRIREIPGIVSIDEVVDLAGRVRLSSQNSTTETVIVGVNPNYFKIAEIAIDQGKFFADTSTDQVVMNEALAGLLGFNNDAKAVIDQKLVVDLIVPEDLRVKDTTEGPLVHANIPVTISGVFKDSKNPILYLPLGLAQTYGVVNRSSLKIKVGDRNNVTKIRKQIENIGFSTEYVGDTVEQIAQVFSLFRIVLGGFGFIALLVAALGTFNTLTISLLERIREVGLLKTLGMKQRHIFRLFIVESVTIGFLGGLLGVLVGTTVGTGVNAFLRLLALRAGSDPVIVYYSPAAFVIIVGVTSLLIGFLTGFYPAYRAIKTNPLDVIRYE